MSITIAAGANIQAAINSNPAGTTFQLSAGTYAGQQIEPMSGDQFIGASGGGTVFNGGGGATPLSTGNGATGVVFQNITTTNYNTPAQHAPIETGSGWQLINVTSTNNSGAGLLLGANSVVQGGNYSDNGQIGIDASGANNAQVLNATIDNNNTANYDQDWDAGGLKMYGSANVVISGDTVSGNNGIGIWADGASSNWTVSNNTVTNNNYVGIQYEISHGANITGNTVSGNANSGILIQTSDGVMVSGNTVTVGGSNNGIGRFYADGGIDIVNLARGTDSNGVTYQAINDTVTNNTITHTTDSAPDGIFYEQPVSGNANNVWNDNTYYVPNTNQTYWFFGNSPTPYTFAELRQATPYESGGQEIIGLPQYTTAAASAPASTAASDPAATTTSSSPAATSSDTASITTDSLTAGTSSTGPTFVASSPTSTTAASGNTSGSTTADATVAAAIATAASTPPAVSVQPSGTSSGTVTTDTTGRSGGHLWLTNHGVVGEMHFHNS